MAGPTLRTLARQLGLSRTTISEALGGSPRVKAETAARVRAAAESAGYVRNPLTGAVMSQLRRSRGQQFRGVIAALEIVDENHTALARRYSSALMSGISSRAEEMGFTVERFAVGPQGIRLNRLDTILHTRGIQGLILLPALGTPDLSALSWDRYTAVYTDYFIETPPLHCVCCDHYRSMVTLMGELHARGYRRPGLFMDTGLSERLQFRWEGAFLAVQESSPEIKPIPVLRSRALGAKEFTAWFRRHRPDVVIGHFPEAVSWMEAAGARLPDAHGFVCLNVLRTNQDCTSLDLQPAQIGARATELVIGQLLHHEMGVPTKPSLTTLPAHLIEGPTLRRRPNDRTEPLAWSGRTVSPARPSTKRPA